MNNDRPAASQTFFFIALAGIFLLIISPTWLSDGMFMDGTIYATLARNLAIGSGTFWQPHFTNTLFPAFVEHPPLATGIEALFFKIFGDTRFVERSYSLLTIILTAIIIVLIWKEIFRKSQYGWIPLLFWIAMPSVNWAAVSHMLENTLAIFICLSVLFCLKSTSSKRILYLILSGIMLSLGFLTKGFVTFTPLALPFFMWLFLRKNNFLSMVADTIIITASAIIPLLLLYLFTGAHEFLPQYIRFAFSKISTGETAPSRFYILYKLAMELLPPAAIFSAFLLYSHKKRVPLKSIRSDIRMAALFFSLGLAGVVPILTTMDQSAYFLLLSLPFFAIAIGILINPLATAACDKINYRSKGYRIFKIAGITVLSAGIILSFYFSGTIKRDKTMLRDLKIISEHLDDDITINILPDMNENWPLYTYYARYKNISFDPDLNNSHDYLLGTTTLYSDTIERSFARIDLDTREYLLFRRKETGSQ